MKMLKLTATLAVLAFALLAFTGCTYEELQFMQAIEQAQNVRSYNAEVQLSFELEFSGGDDEFRENMRRVQLVVNDLTVDQNIRFGRDGSNMQWFMETAITLDPSVTFFDMWIQMCEDTAAFQAVLRVPPMIQAVLPVEFIREYFVIDFNDLMDMDMDLMGEIPQFDMADAFEMLRFVQGTGTITSHEDARGRTVLTFSMTNEDFRELLASAFWGYLLGWGEMDDFAQEMIAAMLLSLGEEFAGAQILGESGLTYAITLNSNGYVVNEELSAEINLGWLFDGDSDGDASLFIRYQVDYRNINSARPVAFPNLHSGNSMSLTEVIYQAEQRRIEQERQWQMFRFLNNPSEFTPYMDLDDAPATFPFSGTIGGREIETEIQIMYVNGRFAAPVSQIAEIFGDTFEYHDTIPAVTWTTPENMWGEYVVVVIFPLDYYDIDAFELDEIFYVSPATWDLIGGYLHDGTMFVPLVDIQWMIGVDFGFDIDTGTVVARTWGWWLG